MKAENRRARRVYVSSAEMMVVVRVSLWDTMNFAPPPAGETGGLLSLVPTGPIRHVSMGIHGPKPHFSQKTREMGHPCVCVGIFVEHIVRRA